MMATTEGSNDAHIIIRAVAVAAVAAAVALGVGSVAYAANSDARLLRTYQPVTRFDPTERFRPASIESFIGDADVERFDGSSWIVVDSDPEPGDLPGPGTGTWRLNQDSCTPAAPIGDLDSFVRQA